jgi:hypothetical protein
LRDFGTTALDTPGGASELAASSAGVAPTATFLQSLVPVQGPAVKAAPTDVRVNSRQRSSSTSAIGQYDALLSPAENRTSEVRQREAALSR